tara:strand:+ start:2376 stop:2639 length:264 start_codon:yes stop_codon:yes gene_type:complete
MTKEIKIITINSKISELDDVKTEIHKFKDSKEHPWTKAGKMSIGQFLRHGYKIRAFGRAKYRRVIRAAVFSEFIDYDSRELILDKVL